MDNPVRFIHYGGNHYGGDHYGGDHYGGYYYGVEANETLVDTLDPVCQHPYYDEFTMPSIYIGMDDYESSMAVEESITEDEKVRAKALEAMLMYDNMVSAQKSKEEILD